MRSLRVDYIADRLGIERQETFKLIQIFAGGEYFSKHKV